MFTYSIILAGLFVSCINSLELLTKFSHQVTGVTVTSKGRIFVNFPRWTEDSPISVAEVNPITGEINAYPPNSQWNSWRNSDDSGLNASIHFVCVQSVIAHPNGKSLWVLDPGAPALGFLVPNGPKLVEIDLETNQTRRIILFDDKVALQGSYLNDVRFYDSYAYITDSGVTGALIVVDLNNGHARRVLHGHPSTQSDPTVIVKADGKPIRKADGHRVVTSSDGIALSPDGSILYWQALTGKTLFSIDRLSLHKNISCSELEKRIRIIGENGPADGLLISRRYPERMYITSIENDIVLMRNLTDGKVVPFTDQTEFKQPSSVYCIRWPDTLAEGPDGSIYVTASHIQDSAFFKSDAPIALPTELWRFKMVVA